MDLMAWYRAEPLFLLCAAISTAFYILMFAITLFGGNGGDGSFDLDSGDAHTSSDASFKLFSIQSLLAFCMGFGWTGLSTRIEWGLSYWVAVPLAIFIGLAFMFVTAWMLAKVYGLSHEPQKTLQPAIGAFGKVYMSLPAKGAGKGQVQVVIDGQLRTVGAVSSGNRIKEFTEVEILGVQDESTLIVREKSI